MEDGDLAAGDYPQVIGEFSTPDPAGTLQDFIDAGDFGDEAVNFNVTFTTNVSFTAVPEPANAMVVAGLGVDNIFAPSQVLKRYQPIR